MSAFTVFSSDCILLNNLIDGLEGWEHGEVTTGAQGRTQPDVLGGWAEPPDLPRWKPWAAGEEQEGRQDRKGQTEGRTSLIYK